MEAMCKLCSDKEELLEHIWACTVMEGKKTEDWVMKLKAKEDIREELIKIFGTEKSAKRRASTVKNSKLPQVGKKDRGGNKGEGIDTFKPKNQY